MAGDDLQDHATSSVDFYELLELTAECTENDIKRAYRRAALKYHPDKHPDKPDLIEKFHLIGIAQGVLSDSNLKAVYDNTRRAKKEKAERDAALNGRRRQMMEDLERREREGDMFMKRKRDEEEAGDELERKIRRLAEDGARRRKERDELMRRERLEQEERMNREADGFTVPETAARTPRGGTEVPEIDRTVKVQWVREGAGESIDKDRLNNMFGTFGKVEHVAVLKERKKRLGDGKAKTVVASAIVVFASVVSAHAAVDDAKKQTSPSFRALESVYWAANKEPDFVHWRTGDQTTAQSPSLEELTRIRVKNAEKTRLEELMRPKEAAEAPTTPSKAETNGNRLRKAPSFAFSPAGFNTPKSSPFSTTSSQSPSLEELTRIRMRNAEKKRMEEQIRKEEADLEASEPV